VADVSGQTAGAPGAGTALVVGGSSGIGAACVESLRAAGWPTAVFDLKPDPGEDAIAIDVRDREAVFAAVAELVEAKGPLGTVVYAAGTARVTPILAVEPKEWELVLGVNLTGAFHALQQLVSHKAATIFGIALLASGFASSSVGTMAGQVVMQGFIHRQIPLFLRRAITLAPALFVLAIGVNPTDALVGSQVVLSFGIPFALVPLLIIASKRDIMGAMVNPRWLSVVAGAIASLIIALNVFLLYEFVAG